MGTIGKGELRRLRANRGARRPPRTAAWPSSASAHRARSGSTRHGWSAGRAETRIVTEFDGREIVRRCAYCPPQPVPPGVQVSHGCCARHFAEVMAQIAARRVARLATIHGGC